MPREEEEEEGENEDKENEERRLTLRSAVEKEIECV